MFQKDRISDYRRLAIEFIFLFGLLLVSLIPFWQKIGVVPNFLSIVLYLWIIYRPDLISWRIFIVLGICRDATMGYPIGVSVLEIILAITITRPFRRFVLTRNFWVVFWGYGVFITLNNFMFWGILSGTKGFLLPISGVVKPILINLLIYPLICELSLFMQNKIDFMKSWGLHG